MTWVTVAGDYQITLRGDQIVCRNPAGKELRSPPKAVRDDPATANLRQLSEWLTRHDSACRAEVEQWMVRSLPLPATALAKIWPDPSWRTPLTDVVVATLDDDGGWDPDEVGFLREATDTGIGVVNLDGETVRLAADRVLIAHPVLLSEVDDLREFAADLGVQQSIDQLFRQTWIKPSDVDPAASKVADFAGGKYDQLRHLAARSTSLGYPVKGGYAVCRVFEGGDNIEARVWIGSDYPEDSTATGELIFTDRNGTSRTLGDVGPVAWSEGMRMAAALYAGRVVEKQEEQE